MVVVRTTTLQVMCQRRRPLSFLDDLLGGGGVCWEQRVPPPSYTTLVRGRCGMQCHTPRNVSILGMFPQSLRCTTGSSAGAHSCTSVSEPTVFNLLGGCLHAVNHAGAGTGRAHVRGCMRGGSLRAPSPQCGAPGSASRRQVWPRRSIFGAPCGSRCSCSCTCCLMLPCTAHAAELGPLVTCGRRGSVMCTLPPLPRARVNSRAPECLCNDSPCSGCVCVYVCVRVLLVCACACVRVNVCVCTQAVLVCMIFGAIYMKIGWSWETSCHTLPARIVVRRVRGPGCPSNPPGFVALLDLLARGFRFPAASRRPCTRAAPDHPLEQRPADARVCGCCSTTRWRRHPGTSRPFSTP